MRDGVSAPMAPYLLVAHGVECTPKRMRVGKSGFVTMPMWVADLGAASERGRFGG